MSEQTQWNLLPEIYKNICLYKMGINLNIFKTDLSLDKDRNSW